MNAAIKNILSLPFTAPWGYTLAVIFFLIGTAGLGSVAPFGSFVIDGESATFGQFWAAGCGPILAGWGVFSVYSLISLLKRKQVSRYLTPVAFLLISVLGFFTGNAGIAVVLILVALIALLYFLNNSAIIEYYQELNCTSRNINGQPVAGGDATRWRE